MRLINLPSPLRLMPHPGIENASALLVIVARCRKKKRLAKQNCHDSNVCLPISCLGNIYDDFTPPLRFTWPWHWWVFLCFSINFCSRFSDGSGKLYVQRFVVVWALSEFQCHITDGESLAGKRFRLPCRQRGRTIETFFYFCFKQFGIALKTVFHPLALAKIKEASAENVLHTQRSRNLHETPQRELYGNRSSMTIEMLCHFQAVSRG